METLPKQQLRAVIREISIRNFRGIRDLSLSFAGPGGQATDLVVLAGPNGSGKTSVLEACLIATGHGQALVRETVQRSNYRPPIPAPDTEYRIGATFETSEETVRVEYRPGFRQQWGSFEEAPSLRPLQHADVPYAYFSSWRAPRLMGPQPITAGKRGKRPSTQEEDRLWLVKQHLVNARTHEALGFPHSNGSDAPVTPFGYREIIAKLDETWRLFYPGSHQRFDVRPVGADPDAGFDVFLVDGQDEAVPLDHLSSGELEIFNFVGWMLVSRFEGGIICIDEPELHLDPQWHGLILQALRRLQPHSQFIVATHSPAVYDAAFSFQRHLLIPPGDARRYTWSVSDQAGINR